MPGAVADVVADVVGDRRRVARVVLGDAGLDLADEVGADVGRLREDAAAEPGEHRDQRAAEAEPDQRVDGRLRAVVEERRQRAVVAGDADQRQPDDQQAGDRAAAEGDPQRRRDAAAGGLGDARVGAHRHVHADVAGRAGQDAADRKAARDRDVLDEDQRDEQHDARRSRSSCTGGSGRRARPAERPARCSASSRCRAKAPAGSAWSPGRRPRRMRRKRGRRRPHGSSESCSTEILRGLICVPREDVSRAHLTSGSLSASALPGANAGGSLSCRPRNGGADERQRRGDLLSVRAPTAGRSTRPARDRPACLLRDARLPGGGRAASRRRPLAGRLPRRRLGGARPAPRARRPSAGARARRAAVRAPAGSSARGSPAAL